jgi:ATP-binding cassette subfamily B protein
MADLTNAIQEAEAEEVETALSVIRRGLKTTPELLQGLAATALIGVAVAAGQISVPIVIQLALDRGGLTSGDVDTSTVVKLVLFGLAVLIATEILALIAKRRMIARAEASLRRLRVMGFDHVHRQTLAVHNEQATGIMISRVTSDVDSLSRFTDWGLFVWIVQPIVVVGVFIAMAVYSWQLALLALFAFAPVFIAMRWVRKRMALAHDERRTAIGDLLGAFSEALSGAEVVRAYNAQHRTQTRLDQVSETRYRKGLRANFYMSGVYVVGDIVGAVMLALVLLVGVTQREALDLSSGSLVAILFLITLLLSPIAELGETINNAQEAVAGWRKILDLLDQPIEDLDPPSGATLPEGPLAFGASKVNFDYGDGVPILRDVSVMIPAGVRVAIVGETGSGKSTFARLLCRLADPIDGVVSIGGLDLREVSGTSRQSAVRMVPQDGFLFDTTIRENIAFGRNGAEDDDIDRAIELLNLGAWVDGLPLGLETPVGERGSSLSVGERQLVSFARAAVADPGILILDEATSSVDPQTDLQLTRALDRLADGRTIVSIAHRLSTAESADIVLVFHAGELVEQGSHDDLVGLGGRYADLFAAWAADAATRP